MTDPHLRDPSGSAAPEPTPVRSRVRRFWARHRTAFWALHSVWALATGVAVIVLARERYGFVPWVVLFLVLTWASTLFFNRQVSEGDDEERSPTPGFGVEATSYLTRAMYQETMFFLLPFYAYSTVLGTWNVLFTGMLAVLALLSCLDLVFDRWLRTNPLVSLLFFSVVAFAAVNLLLPILLPIDPVWAERLAAGAAVGSALPLVLRGSLPSTADKALVAGAAALFLAVALFFPRIVPPVPLRLESATFSSGIEPEALALPDTLEGSVRSQELDGLLVLLTEVFAPGAIPTRVSLLWERDGLPVRSSRDIEITAHDLGFRVWDSWRPDEGRIPPGRYRVLLRASGGRIFGAARLQVRP